MKATLSLPTRLRRAVRPLPEDRLRLAWQAISLLLEYPSEDLLALRSAMSEAIAPLPALVGDPLRRFLDHLGTRPLRELQESYVATFDTDRRHCLYLTYFAHGDTRKRGLALVQVKQAYRRAGLDPTGEELPDHLCLVLEFGASADVEGAWRMLNDHRPGVEMLRIALQEAASPWADVAVALCATLPALHGDDADAVQRLIVQGPPAEDVGLDAYSLDPRLTPPAASGAPS
ncbi:MAG: nitrate reductase molybdenum cofactor assembly chaperone [Kineosporiaceae bacterium]